MERFHSTNKYHTFSSNLALKSQFLQKLTLTVLLPDHIQRVYLNSKGKS